MKKRLRVLEEKRVIAQKKRPLDLGSRPSYWLRPTLTRIGKKWRALYGENPQDGVAGFGDTPHEAFVDFDQHWFTHRGPSAFQGKAMPNDSIRIQRRAKE